MRERITVRWPRLAYYVGLFSQLGSVVSASVTTTGHLTTIVLVVATALGGVVLSVIQQNGWWVVAAFVVLLLAGLLKANYAEIRTRDLDIERLTREKREIEEKARADFMKQMNRTMREIAHDAVLAATKKGTDEIFVPLRDEENPSEIGWTATVDAWDAGNIQMLRKWWTEEAVTIYTTETGLVGQIDDWRTRLLTHVRVRIERLFEVLNVKGKYADDE